MRGVGRGRGQGRRARIAAVGAVVLLSGCGLDYYPYVYPPEFGSVTVDSFTFAGPSKSGLLFRGYEIYYKLYAPADPALDTETDFAGRIELEAAGFIRLTREGEMSPDLPLIEVPLTFRQMPHTVTITFPLGDQPFATTSWEPLAPVLLRRGIRYPFVEDAAERYQLFADITEDDVNLTPPTDITIPVWSAIDSGAPVKLSLFALSYGSDLAVPYYSRPVRLFVIDYTVVTQ